MPFIKSYLSENVYDAALDRIRWLFDEFPNVIVNISGGKDSTVIRNLALKVAEEKGRLPLKVYHCDLEVEWDMVIAYVREILSDPRIEAMWMQIPLPKGIINASSMKVPYFHCWDESKRDVWMRPKEPTAYQENIYGAESYYDLFTKFDHIVYSGVKTCRIGGVRTEESPARMMGLTSYETYNGATWGNKHSKTKKDEHYTFYPIYDWSYTDVWKSIHDNHWKYCPIYDLQYQYGVPIKNMRISSVIHESSVRTLFHMQEFEPDTWNRLTKRVPGANSTAHLRSDFFKPKELPFMFESWAEYRDYLLENLITDKDMRQLFKDQFQQEESMFIAEALPELIILEINAILTMEIETIKLQMFRASHGRMLKTAGKRWNRE